VGPVARIGIDVVMDPVAKHGLEITVHMVVVQEGKAADVAF
jgi:hypothetical protein